MKKQRKTLLCVLSLCICLFAGMWVSFDTQAEEYEGRPITGMDEEGNIYEIEPEVGLVEEEITTFANSNEKIVNFNTKGNDVTNFTEVGTGDAGYTNGASGADAAYLGESGGKVKFMLSGVIGEVNKSEVQVLNKSSAKSVSHYTVSGGWLVHRITTNLNSSNYAGSIRCGRAPSFLAQGGTYYSYDGHYFYASDKFAAMLNDYKNNSRSSSINPGSPYYNYFQYLPMRSSSSYSSASMDSLIASETRAESKMRGIGPSLVSHQNTYGVNGLLTAGIAANESAWGNSNLALTKNNIFGINAVDSNPDDAFSYASIDICIKAFSETYMSKGYLNPKDWRYFGGFLGNKASGINVKYASDPYWGEKAAAAAWFLDEAGGNQDQNVYTIAIKDTMANSHQNVQVRAESNSGSTVLYSTGTQSNTSLLILDNTSQNGFYKVISDGVLNSSRTGLDTSSGKFDFSSMYGYVAADSIVIVNKGTNLAGVDRFTDVDGSAWFYEYVKFVYDRGIMTGMDTFRFGPGEDLSRAQFATILYRMAGSPSVSYSNVFPDVQDGYFFTSPVLWAYGNQVITGYENGIFGPGDLITREQMAVLMYRYAKYCGLNTKDSADLNSFPDAGKVSGFSKEAMRWAVGAGLIQGDQGTLNPQGNASRAHCATIITRFLQKYGL